MTRILARALLGAMLILVVPVAVPASPAAADSYPSLCPAMTDSITRLYNAYFGRDPEPAGFNHWVGLYKTGSMSLEEISQSFARSPEFSELGLVGDESYTRWLYRNLLEREPTSNELNHWVRALGGGYPRGSVTLTLTESSDFVRLTNTVPPLAGYLRWYPKGTHFYCDIGSVTSSTDLPLSGDLWADYYLKNRSDEDQEITLWTLDEGQRREVRMSRGTLPAGLTDYNWDGVFSGDGDYGRYIQVQAGPTTEWIVVFYPRSIGEDRLGWQLSS